MLIDVSKCMAEAKRLRRIYRGMYKKSGTYPTLWYNNIKKKCDVVKNYQRVVSFGGADRRS